MKTIITLLPLLLFTVASHAEIYKGTDAEGNVIYSDEELPNTTEIQVPEPTSIPMPKPEPKKTVEEETEDTVAYELFKILSPSKDETIRIASGDMPVSLSITPELDIEQGHRITVYIDGTASLSTTKLNIQIPNVDRGSHSVRAEIKDNKNKVLIKSNTVTFHMKRHSTQHKKPAGAS